MAFSGSPCLAFSNSLCSEHSGLMVSLSACLSPRSSIPDQSLAAPSYLGDGHSGWTYKSTVPQDLGGTERKQEPT